MTENVYLKIFANLWSNDLWKCGFLSGITVSSLVGVLFSCYPYWNSRLSFILNILNILDIRTGLLLSKLQYLKQKDLDGINHSRKMQLLLPLGPMRSVKSIIAENIPASQGHHIPIQIITPNNYQMNNPIIVYLHGGGFVIGCVDFYKPTMTSLAQYTGCIVIGVDYRKAPEHKFPAAPNDCLEALSWILDNGGKYGGDTSRICVMGDSAGGMNFPTPLSLTKFS
jgi:acetyl esterase/lipase